MAPEEEARGCVDPPTVVRSAGSQRVRDYATVRTWPRSSRRAYDAYFEQYPE